MSADIFPPFQQNGVWSFVRGIRRCATGEIQCFRRICFSPPAGAMSADARAAASAEAEHVMENYIAGQVWETGPLSLPLLVPGGTTLTLTALPACRTAMPARAGRPNGSAAAYTGLSGLGVWCTCAFERQQHACNSPRASRWWMTQWRRLFPV